MSPSDHRWQPDPTDWIFRGQADAEWPLVAKLHRDPERARRSFALKARTDSHDARWVTDGRLFLDLLDRFQSALDAAGLASPIALPRTRSSRPTAQYMHEPELEAYPLVALAQHLGLPTPWLDWTVLARNAAYFATVEGAQNLASAQSLGVWAIRRDFLERVDGREVEDVALSMIGAPRSSNPRLHAQAGTFTVLRGPNAPNATLESHVAALGKRLASKLKEIPRPVMRLLRLKTVHAPKLLRLLSYEGVSGATLFPGHDGVVRGMRERAWWDNAPR